MKIKKPRKKRLKPCPTADILFGGKHSTAKLETRQIIAIFYGRDKHHKYWADLYDIGISMVSRIQSKERHADILGSLPERVHKERPYTPRNALFTDREVEMIRDEARYQSDYQLAEKWGCHHTTIRNIRRGISYKHIPLKK